jgi:hypothetical protein
MATRKMTIARALTRKKTLKAQLTGIASDISKYGALNDKTRHPLGDTRAPLAKNHGQAIEKIEALFQQHHDLTKELVKIEMAIHRANSSTVIEIAGVKMTIDEARIFQNLVAPHVQSLVNSYNYSVANAQREVEKYNKNVKVETEDEAVKQLVFADILYLVKPDRVKEQGDFLNVFLAEIDGTLNEVNAVTEIEIEE